MVRKLYGWKPDGLWGTDPLYMVEGGKTYFYHNDHLGTPQRLTSAADGAVVWSAGYLAFGAVVVDPSSTVENNLRFPGQYADAETGLYWNFQRYYDPEGGRYTQVDPIGFAGGDVDLYGYVSSDPLNFIDPSGMQKDLTQKGPFAVESIPAAGPSSRLNVADRTKLNEIGAQRGCQHCGASSPGTKSGNWIADHIPPTAIAEGESQRLYPSCASCSAKQGGQISAMKRGNTTLGCAGAILTLLDFYILDKEAKECGVSPWQKFLNDIDGVYSCPNKPYDPKNNPGGML